MNLSLYKSLKKNYWAKKAAAIYAAMEKEWSPATKPKAVAKSKKDHPSWYWLKSKKTTTKKISKASK